MVHKSLIGKIKLNGIHNDFLDRDILDYKLIFKHDTSPIVFSSGIIKLNNSIYTDFKFSNQIRELGGSEFLFRINEYCMGSYDNIELFLSTPNEILLKSYFNPIKVNNSSFNNSFIFENTKYNLSYNYEILNNNSVFLKLDSLLMNLIYPGKYRLFMWCESDLGKTFVFNNWIVNSNSPIFLKKEINVGYFNDNILLKGELFNSHEVSLIQFEKKIQLGNYEIINENYKKENLSINLSYSVST